MIQLPLVSLSNSSCDWCYDYFYFFVGTIVVVVAVVVLDDFFFAEVDG